MWAGMHIYGSSGTQANHGDSYVVAQKQQEMQVYKTTANSITWKKSFTTATAWKDAWYRYKAVYTPANYSVNVWRNGSWVGKWTDTASGALQTGSYIAPRTNNTNVQYGDVYVNASGANKAKWTTWASWGERPAGTITSLNDTDGEGLIDGAEVKGWPINVWIGGVKNWRNVTASPLKASSDSDGWNDKTEHQKGTDPMAPDTDLDVSGCGGQPTCGNDNVDSTPFGANNSDGDGLADSIETGGWSVSILRKTGWANYTAYSSTGSSDGDNDGLLDVEEWRAGTDAQRYDSDGDGWADGPRGYIVLLQLGRLTVEDDGGWLGPGSVHLALQYPAIGLYVRFPYHVEYEQNTWCMDQAGIGCTKSQDVGGQIWLASNESWTRRITVYSRHEARNGMHTDLGSAFWDLYVGTSTRHQTLTFSGKGNMLETTEIGGAWADPTPKSSRGDMDSDGINDENESKYHTLPGLSVPGGVGPPIPTRDIYVEIDHMTEGSYDNHSVNIRQIERLGGAFQFYQYQLHIDMGGMGGGGGVPHSTGHTIPFETAVPGAHNDFEDYYLGYFHQSRRNVFRYVLVAHTLTHLGQEVDGASTALEEWIGISEYKRGIHQGAGVMGRSAIGSTIMHELGHTLGLVPPISGEPYPLSFRGIDSTVCMWVDYPSVMNYHTGWGRSPRPYRYSDNPDGPSNGCGYNDWAHLRLGYVLNP
jgi:hypothetical protein